MQYIGQLASRPWWQAWLGSIYPVLGVLTLVLLAVVNLRLRAAGRRNGPPVADAAGIRDVAAGVVDCSATRESGAPG